MDLFKRSLNPGCTSGVKTLLFRDDVHDYSDVYDCIFPSVLIEEEESRTLGYTKLDADRKKIFLYHRKGTQNIILATESRDQRIKWLISCCSHVKAYGKPMILNIGDPRVVFGVNYMEYFDAMKGEFEDTHIKLILDVDKNDRYQYERKEDDEECSFLKVIKRIFTF